MTTSGKPSLGPTAPKINIDALKTRYVRRQVRAADRIITSRKLSVDEKKDWFERAIECHFAGVEYHDCTGDTSRAEVLAHAEEALQNKFAQFIHQACVQQSAASLVRKTWVDGNFVHCQR